MKITGHLILAAMLSAMASSAAGAADGKEKLFVIINYSVYRCNIEIELNGINLTRTDRDASYTVTGFSDIGPWIYPGENTLMVRIKPPAKKIDASAKPSIEISISTAKEGQMSNEGKKFFEFRIPEKDTDTRLDDIRSPIMKKVTFTPAYVPPSALWNSLKPVKLDDAARKQIKKIVKDYHAALIKKDIDAIYSLLEFSATDMMRLRHQPLEGLKANMRQSFKEMTADKNFILLPLDTEKLVMKPVADGKIIQVTNSAGEAPVRTKPAKDSGSYAFPVFTGFIDGKWIIVR